MKASCGAGPLRHIVILLALCHGLAARASGEQCSSPPLGVLLQLLPCRAAVVPFSPAAKPTQACCAAIKALGRPCLCSLFANGPPISGVDVGAAMQLPRKCAVDFAPCEL